MSLLQALQAGDQSIVYILWRKVKRMNKEERMGASAKQSSCMTLKTLPRKADTEDLISYC